MGKKLKSRNRWWRKYNRLKMRGSRSLLRKKGNGNSQKRRQKDNKNSPNMSGSGKPTMTAVLRSKPRETWMTIYEATGTALHGELSLFDNLDVVTLPFRGTIKNGQADFMAKVPRSMTSITWHGIISGTELTGTYSARCASPNADPSLRHQEGVWSCKLIRQLGAPKPETAHFVWVYHDGVEDGPFTPSEYMQRLNAGHWCRNAIVGLIDRTIWTTTGDYWTKSREPAPTTKYLPRRSHSLWQRLKDGLESLQMPRWRSNRRVRSRRKPQMSRLFLIYLKISHGKLL